MYSALLRYSVLTLVMSLSLISSPFSSLTVSAVTDSGVAISYVNMNYNPKVSLESKTKEWIQALSKQAGWENWGKAKWSIYTLGPGTHGWIVELTEGTEAIGYMIVLATEDGDFVLSEYGKGQSPLFSEQTLSNALQSQEIVPDDPTSAKDSLDNAAITANIQAERFYYDALQALWRIETFEGVYFLDANTGEQLPLNELPDIKQKSVAHAQHTFTGLPSTVLRTTFDPYDQLSWVTGKPLQINQLSDLQEVLKTHSRVTFVSNLYDNTYHAPVPVLGYSKWQDNEEPYLIIDQNGERFIPLTTALALGLFYP